MKVKFWGTCGSIASPISSNDIEAKIRQALLSAPSHMAGDINAVNQYLDSMPHWQKGTFRGNTSCVQVTPASGDILIFDAGTGIRPCASSLLAGECGKGQGNVHLFFSHLHWDHIQGFPFFVPIYIKGNKINVYGPIEDLEDKVKHQMSSPYFPVLFEYLAADFQFHELTTGDFVELGGATKVSTELLYHPQGSHAYSVTDGVHKVVYMTDSEFNMKDISLIQSAVEFAKDADVLIFDSQYTFEDTITKIDWGHSSVFTGVDIASAANVSSLYLFHHEPAYTDEKIESMIYEAHKYRDKVGASSLNIEGAYDGLEVVL
jgi:phosphoribosyl 1,2-cyclic phosphodiesterase